MRRDSAQEIKNAARGRWPEILSALSDVDREVFNGKNIPCPMCGGTDRFRFTNMDGDGSCLCNQCFRDKSDKNGGDGIAALMWLRGIEFKEARDLLLRHLGLEEERPQERPREKSRDNGTIKEPMHEVAHWFYNDQDGVPRHLVKRRENATGDKKKFSITLADGTPLPPAPAPGEPTPVLRRYVPLHLDRLVRAERGSLVLVLEGEKCCDEAEKLGFLATTNPMGAGCWGQIDPAALEAFRSLEVVILPDKDKPGEKHGEDVAKSLSPIAETVKVLNLPGLPDAGDICDWVAARDGKTSEEIHDELMNLAERRPAWTSGFAVYYFGDPDLKHDFPQLAPLVKGILHRGYVAVSGTRKKTHKTEFFLGLSMALELGVPFLGREVTQARPLWVQRDTPPGDFLEYTKKIRLGLGLRPMRIPFTKDPLDLMLDADRDRLIATVLATHASVVFLDSCRAIARVKQNESDEVAALVRGFINDVLRDTMGLTIVVIGHPPKAIGSMGMMGSGDWENAADSILQFDAHCVGRRVSHIDLSGEGRHAPVSLTFAIDDLTEHGGPWTLREVSEEEQEEAKEHGRAVKVGRKTPAQEIEDLLRRNPSGWFSMSEISDAIGRDWKTVVRNFPNLIGRDLVEHDGKDAKHRKWRWALTK